MKSIRPLKGKPLTKAQIAATDARIAKAMNTPAYRKATRDARESERLTAADYAITINAKAPPMTAKARAKPRARIPVGHLSISTWIGLAPDATHYFGRISFYEGDKRTEHELSRRLTAAQARAKNKREDLHRSMYRAGLPVTDFDSREAVIDAGVAWWKENGPAGGILLLGNPARADPMPCLHATPAQKRRLAALLKRAEAIDFWENDEASMKVISREWDEFFAASALARAGEEKQR